MGDRSILFRLLPGLQGGFVTVARAVQLEANYVGVLDGVNNTEGALQRFDGTGLGAAIFTFTGPFSAAGNNINDWFGGKQLVRLRCIDSGTGPSVSGVVRFDLPGTSALNTAFDTLVAAGLPEQIRFVIEYTGPGDDFLQIFPRVAPSPQITNTSSIIVRTGVAATIEVTRSSGTISNFVFQSIGAVGGDSNLATGSVRLINPTNAIWDASANGPLPSTNVAQGNAYRVVNAPSDGSGRFGEVMQNGDWVVWEGAVFTSWSATPLQWFVIPGHDVRRITALEQDFLTDIQISPVSDRNTIVRGANYADTAAELRLKIYENDTDYTPADLNTTGDIDEYVNNAPITGTLAIRLDRNSTNLTTPLTDLYVYVENADGSFVLIGNMARDFAFRGDFGAESDYTSINDVAYTTGQTIRIYLGTSIDRYESPNLDITESNLTPAVQTKLNRNDTQGINNEHRIESLESKVSALFPLTPDVGDLATWASIFTPAQASQIVDITRGYSLLADYRGDATRYESAGVVYDNTGTNVVRYSGLTSNLQRVFGMKVTAPSNKVLLSVVEGTEVIPYIDMTATGNFRVNNYLESTQPGTNVRNQIHFLTRSAGDERLNPNEANVSTYIVTEFPVDSTGRSRTFQIDIDTYDENGNVRDAGHFVTLEIPAENTPQARIVRTDPVPLSFSQTVNITYSYELRQSASDYVIDFRFIRADSAAVTGIRLEDVATLLNYTSAATTVRTDRWLIFSDAGLDYMFSGEAELVISFQPLADGNTTQVVGVSSEANGRLVEFNDIRTLVPEGGFSTVEIPDDIDFRTFLADHFFRHLDLANIVSRANTQWVYGLALLRDVNEFEITGELDFTSFILIAPNATRWRVTVDNAGTLITTQVV